MIEDNVIKAAKAVDINKVLDKFNWGTDITGTFILCPNPLHDDHNPSVSINRKDNTCRCFTCRKGEGITFDTINLYQSLCEKVDGRRIPFPQAVKEVLALDGMTLNQTMKNIGINQGKKQNTNKSAFDTVIGNSKPLTGYELNYLHNRGIMLYDAYVYMGKVYTKQSIDKELQSTTDKQRIEELEQIKQEGKFFKGIAPILKANRIQIKHNYWQGVNSIIYLVSYDCSEDEELEKLHFLMDTERNMAIKKSMDSAHQKQALGESDFCFITEGMDKKGDIYITEGIEDALCYTMNGEKSISLNSVANVKFLIEYLKNNHSRFKRNRLIISLDHDEAGEIATQRLVDFFEAYNQQHPKHSSYEYGICQYPEKFHDINDYWVSKIKEM